MIYTTYFYKLQFLPADIIPIAICVKAPLWYSGLQYSKLAPTKDCLWEWQLEHNRDTYIPRYQREILSVLKPDDVIKELLALVNNSVGIEAAPHIALACYERPSDFCHRHLVADWLNAGGIPCTELAI